MDLKYFFQNQIVCVVLKNKPFWVMQKLHQIKYLKIIAMIIIFCGIIFQQCRGYFNIFLYSSITAYKKKHKFVYKKKV